jgi:hypothetical protein
VFGQANRRGSKKGEGRGDLIALIKAVDIEAALKTQSEIMQVSSSNWEM